MFEILVPEMQVPYVLLPYFQYIFLLSLKIPPLHKMCCTSGVIIVEFFFGNASKGGAQQLASTIVETACQNKRHFELMFSETSV